MWALPGTQLCYPEFFQSVSNAIATLNMGTPRAPTLSLGILAKRVKHYRNVEYGHSQGVNFVARHPLKVCKTFRKIEWGTTRESILLPDVLSRRSKLIRNVECWHSQGVNFVSRHPLKACETQWIAWRCVVSPGSHLLGECAATKVSAHVR